MATPKWKAALEQRKARKDANDVKSFKLGNGKTTLRILPNPDNPDELFYQDFGQHWVKSKTEKRPDGSPKIIGAALCLEKAFEQDCPFCNALSEARGHMDDNEHDFTDEEMNLVKEAGARHRVLINAAIRNGGGYEVKMVDLPTTAFNAIIDLIAEYGEEMVASTGGKDIVITRSGSGINTTYAAMPAKASGSDIDDSWKQEAIRLSEYVKTQAVSGEKGNRLLDGVGKLANLSLSTTALPAPTARPALANPTPVAKPVESDSVLDDVQNELDDVPFDTTETTTPASAPVETESQDDDLLSALDDLDDL